jgi:hypothetical protein
VLPCTPLTKRRIENLSSYSISFIIISHKVYTVKHSDIRMHFNSGANLPESYSGATSRYLGNYRASSSTGLTGL